MSDARDEIESRWAAEGKRLVALFADAFRTVPKPVHFTDFGHCEECAEHDATLRRYDRDTLPLTAVDNQGWCPLCFIRPEGLRYYSPGLVRLGFEPGGRCFLGHFVAFFRCSSAYGPMELSRAQSEAIADLAATLGRFSVECEDLEFDAPDIQRIAALWEQHLQGAHQPVKQPRVAQTERGPGARDGDS